MKVNVITRNLNIDTFYRASGKNSICNAMSAVAPSVNFSAFEQCETPAGSHIISALKRKTNKHKFIFDNPQKLRTCLVPEPIELNVIAGLFKQTQLSFIPMFSR